MGFSGYLAQILGWHNSVKALFFWEQDTMLAQALEGTAALLGLVMGL
jgi:hypothetical protein